ncbi:MAG: hypothetical protein RLZZ585_172 [Bacteroidota bacterium]|jgi:hypothetical protein
MKYNLYQVLIEENRLDFMKSESKNKGLDELLSRIQSVVVSLYETKQNKEAGIKKLGNEIRYSEELNNLLENNSLGYYLVKFTENSRYFLSRFIETTLTTNESEIYFIILHGDFGKESKLVDNSFIRINQVKRDLIAFFDCYKPRIKLPVISFVEITGFSNYFFEDRDGFNFIHKMNTNDR